MEINKQKSAKEYIERHNLDKVMPELMNTLVHEMARKPEIFMVKLKV